MRTYRTQTYYRTGPSAPARTALALFFLALTGNLLMVLTPLPDAGSRQSENIVLLALSLPKPVVEWPLALAVTPAIEATPTDVAEVAAIVEAPPEPIVESIPDPVVDFIPAPEPAVVAEAILEPTPEPIAETAPLPAVELTPVPEPAPAPAVMAEAILQPTPEPIAETVPLPAVESTPEPEPVTEAVAEPPPVLEAPPPVAAEPEPAPEAMPKPVLVVALAVSADDGEPVPYAVGDLAPGEAAAMPDDAPPPTVAEKTPQEAAAVAAVTAAAPDAPPEPLLDRAKAPPAPLWLAYARPSDAAADRPRIAVVVAGLGLGRAATKAAIKLPGAITLAFVSYARDLQEWIDLARAAGHEVLLDVPMEPERYPRIDPGPQALLTSLSRAENAARLEWHLNRASGYVGVTHNMGSRFTASADDMRPILMALKQRGLMFLDARTSANSVAARLATSLGLPRAINNRFLDAKASRLAIDRRIDEIERIAVRDGFSVAVSHAYPVTIERLERWIATLEAKKLTLVPVSALVDKQDAE